MISCAYSTTSVFPNRVTDIFCQTSQSWCVGAGRPCTNSGRHWVTYTSAHRIHKSVQRVPQRRQSVQKSPLYTNSGGILPVIQEQVHRVRERTMSQNSHTLMEYVQGSTTLRSARKLCKNEKAISTETLFEDFVDQIETAVDAVATQVPYTREQIVSISFTIVENAGIYYNGVKEWRRKDTADKTWEAFKTFLQESSERAGSSQGHQLQYSFAKYS